MPLASRCLQNASRFFTSKLQVATTQLANWLQRDYKLSANDSNIILGAAMQKAGLGRAKAHYAPPMTLLYDTRRVDEQPIETIRWTAREFVLVHSLLGRGVYKSLGRWPLRG